MSSCRKRPSCLLFPRKGICHCLCCISFRQSWEHPTSVSEQNPRHSARWLSPHLCFSQGSNILNSDWFPFAPCFSLCHLRPSHSLSPRSQQTAPTITLAVPSATPPATAPTTTFHDPAYHLSFDYPANWTLLHPPTDRESAPSTSTPAPPRAAAKVRAVVAMPENPFPASHLLRRLRLLQRHTAHLLRCLCRAGPRHHRRQEHIPQTKPGDKTQIAGILFTHGHDEQKDIRASPSTTKSTPPATPAPATASTWPAIISAVEKSPASKRSPHRNSTRSAPARNPSSRPSASTPNKPVLPHHQRSSF